MSLHRPCEGILLLWSWVKTKEEGNWEAPPTHLKNLTLIFIERFGVREKKKKLSKLWISSNLLHLWKVFHHEDWLPYGVCFPTFTSTCLLIHHKFMVIYSSRFDFSKYFVISCLWFQMGYIMDVLFIRFYFKQFNTIY